MRVILFSLILIFIAGCNSQDSSIKNSPETGSGNVDSMPVIVPESPESANVITPKTNSDMPVVSPDSINPD